MKFFIILILIGLNTGCSLTPVPETQPYIIYKKVIVPNPFPAGDSVQSGTITVARIENNSDIAIIPASEEHVIWVDYGTNNTKKVISDLSDIPNVLDDVKDKKTGGDLCLERDEDACILSGSERIFCEKENMQDCPLIRVCISVADNEVYPCDERGRCSSNKSGVFCDLGED